MSTLSSASTLAQINAAYDDNASYAEDHSVAKARVFVTACRLLLRRMATASEHAGEKLERDVRLIKEELADARTWLAAHETDRDGAGAVRHASFEELR